MKNKDMYDLVPYVQYEQLLEPQGWEQLFDDYTQFPTLDFTDFFVHYILQSVWLAPAQEPHIDILDVGCSAGIKSILMSHYTPNANVVGIDVSPKSIDLAYKYKKAYDAYVSGSGYSTSSNLSFLVVDLDKLQDSRLPKFDYINIEDTLMLIENPWEVLYQLTALLKPNGVIRLTYSSVYSRGQLIQIKEAMKPLSFLVTNMFGKTKVDQETLNCFTSHLTNSRIKNFFEVSAHDPGTYLLNFCKDTENSGTFKEIIAKAQKHAALKFQGMRYPAHYALDSFLDITEESIEKIVTDLSVSSKEKIALTNIVYKWSALTREDTIEIASALNPHSRCYDLYLAFNDPTNAQLEAKIYDFNSTAPFIMHPVLYHNLALLQAIEHSMNNSEDNDLGLFLASPYIPAFYGNKLLSAFILLPLVLLFDRKSKESAEAPTYELITGTVDEVMEIFCSLTNLKDDQQIDSIKQIYVKFIVELFVHRLAVPV